MGYGRWDSSDWASFTRTRTAGKSASQIFASSLDPDLDPVRIGLRESRDSADNPLSTPIILAADVTGSMGMVAEKIVRHSLDTLVREVYDRKPVTDPHVMVMAIGDAYCDRAPLQATQFEADIRLAEAMTKIWLEGGGGGNDGESYALAHAFAAMKTATDARQKRGTKGFLFTMGDEPILPAVTAEQMRRVLGVPAERDLSSAELIAMAKEDYEVYHIVFESVGYAQGSRLSRVLASWQAVLPERVIRLSDPARVVETIVSLLQMHAGQDLRSVAGSWSGGTAVSVRKALAALPAPRRGGPSSGVVRF